MKTWVTAGLALSAMLSVMGNANAYVNYPWCIMGESRGLDCVFSTREQCAQDGRNRGFGGQCMRNPNYNPNLPSVVNGTSSPAPAAKKHKSRSHS